MEVLGNKYSFYYVVLLPVYPMNLGAPPGQGLLLVSPQTAHLRGELRAWSHDT